MAFQRKLGWIPDYPDFRDYTTDTEELRPLLARTRPRGAKGTLPARVDLREWCPPVDDQGELGSCTANAAVGLVEYFERRAFGRHLEGSRLFLYKVTRNLLRWPGDRGAFLRTTMGALALFGVPPEEHWPYVPEKFDVEPPAFCYAFAQNYQAIRYLRLDPPGIAQDKLLGGVRAQLAAGLPLMFGFTVYSSISGADRDGVIPFPQPGEKIVGGHAVAAVGYDDAKKALLVRNSWGEGWGEKGYGWLPYRYLEAGLAQDWWCLIKAEWVDTGEFQA